MLYFDSPRKWAVYSGDELERLDMLFVEPEIAVERMPVLVLAKELAAADFDGAIAGNADNFVERLDTVALLFGEGTPSQFFPLTQPFIAMLADLVAQLLKLRD